MMFLLMCKGVIPINGEPFYVESTHPIDSDIRVMLGREKAKRFHEDYLNTTVWNWAEKYEKVAA